MRRSLLATGRHLLFLCSDHALERIERGVFAVSAERNRNAGRVKKAAARAPYFATRMFENFTSFADDSTQKLRRPFARRASLKEASGVPLTSMVWDAP